MNEQLVKLIDKLSYDGTLYSFGHLIYKETVCGPWVTFILSDGSEVYYETEAAKVTLEELEARGLSVVGLNIGSSVEGSDVEIGPYNLEIDDEFTTGAFWRVIDSVDDEAKFYWKRDNAAYYSLRDANGALLAWCEWERFADQPREPTPKEAYYEEAVQAGKFIFYLKLGLFFDAFLALLADPLRRFIQHARDRGAAVLFFAVKGGGHRLGKHGLVGDLERRAAFSAVVEVLAMAGCMGQRADPQADHQLVVNDLGLAFKAGAAFGVVAHLEPFRQALPGSESNARPGGPAWCGARGGRSGYRPNTSVKRTRGRAAYLWGSATH